MRRKSAKVRFVPSNLYKPRENCTLPQTFSFSYLCPQRPQFAILTRLGRFGNGEAEPDPA